MTELKGSSILVGHLMTFARELDGHPARWHPRKHRWVFTPEEDNILAGLVSGQEVISWSEVAVHLPGRSSRQFRGRWIDYLSPDISLAAWTRKEDAEIIANVNRMGRTRTAITRLLA
jgi:myb proto-oncogene protein